MTNTPYNISDLIGTVIQVPLTATGIDPWQTPSVPYLSNVCFNSLELVNSFAQNNITNFSNGITASSDWIATADTGSDTTGYVDHGINCSGFSSGTWTINGALDGYHYCAGGNLAVGTDTVGKNLVFFTGGTLAANSRMVIADTQILLQVPYASTAKTVFNNGATTTYTIPTTSDYVYLTTSAASLTVTFPAAAAAIDGREVTLVVSASVATAVLQSTGGTFVGAPTSFAANTRYSFKYHHATTQWLPC